MTDRMKRRSFIARSLGVSFAASAKWFPAFADLAAQPGQTPKSCILLWMAGGPSQLDTLDPKPDHANGGEFKPISTSVPGVQISEHLPTVAANMDKLAIVRSMTAKEGDHGRATHLAHTGRLPQGPIKHPTFGSLVSHGLPDRPSDLPAFVSIAPNRFLSPAAFSPGFLGPGQGPLIVGDTNIARPVGEQSDLSVRNLKPRDGISDSRTDRRIELLRSMQHDFHASHPDAILDSYQTAYEKAVRMMKSSAAEAFDIDSEDEALREAYGTDNLFGESCLVARRLVERGVKFVEVSLNGVDGNGGIGWDTHAQNFESVKNLSGVLDPAWGTLLTDLSDRGLLDSTLVIWMGEFGRTPVINDNGGRDHFPVAFSAAVAGAGIRGGQVIGASSDDGMEVADRPVKVPDLLATCCQAVGLDPTSTNMSNIGRPIPLLETDASVVEELLA